MTNNEPMTQRCQHCGGLRKEHAKRAPYKCPTRMSESYWSPWTVEAYEAATAASAAKAAAEQAAREAARTCPFCKIIHGATMPVVHLNGTADMDLRDQLQAAVQALRAALDALCFAAPNGRDYYLVEGALAAATRNHERRWSELSRMVAELEEQRDHVQAVMDFEAERRASREVR